jgi:serine/threonine protein kinase
MEFVEGGTLHDCIQTSGKMSEPTVQHIIRQILCALEYMHERHQVSHRDLKPAVHPIPNRD